MPGAWGGKRQGAGRKLSPLRTSKAAIKLIDQIRADPNTDTPLDFLWRVACDDTVELPLRVQCARDVAPYLFPKLAAVAVTSADSNKLVIEFRDYAKPIITAIDTKQLATDLAVDAVLSELDQPLSDRDQAAD